MMTHVPSFRRLIRFQPPPLSALVCIAALALSACGGGTVDETIAPVLPPVDTTGGTVQRATLTVRVAVSADDSALVAATGVSLAGLTVRLERSGSTDPVRTALTTANGVVVFAQLPEGLYVLSLDRPLTPAERQRLPATERDVALLAGGAQLTVAPPTRAATLDLVASRRGSLVLSELYRRSPFVGGAAYPWANYWEVYNSSDTIIFLDGILLFRTPHVPVGSQWPTEPCATVNVAERLDPDGLWAISIYAFPGAGREFPLPPGETRVLAVDAMDHASVGLPDLSRAQFEMIGTASDIDNPAAANMLRLVGTTGGLGRGENMISGSMYGLALPVARDTSALLRRQVTNVGARIGVFRIPRDALLDVVGAAQPDAQLMASASWPEGLRPCEPWALPQYERSRSKLFSPEEPQAVRRKSLGRTAEGREILQRTGTASRDFELAQPLRRSLNK
jgi:hypothetical protein